MFTLVNKLSFLKWVSANNRDKRAKEIKSVCSSCVRVWNKQTCPQEVHKHISLSPPSVLSRVTFAKLMHLNYSVFRKCPSNWGHTSQCEALAALNFYLTGPTEHCRDGLCASCPSVGIPHQLGDSASWGSRDAGCEEDLCVSARQKKERCSSLNDSSMFVRGFEELMLFQF